MKYLDKVLEQAKLDGKKIEVITLSSGQEVTVIGDLNVEVLVKSALRELSN